MESTAIGAGCLLTLLAIVLAAAFLAAFKRRKKEAEEQPVKDTRLSFLAVISFFSGLSAVLILVGSSIVSLCGNYSEILLLSSEERPLVQAAAKIILTASLLPAVAALAFALGARGVIRESKEGLRGKSLYRSGVLLAIVTGAFALVGFKRPIEPGTRTIRIHEEETPRGDLGAEVEPGETPGAVRVKAVEEGGPAAAAGLKAGDVITGARARTHRNGVILFPGDTWNSSKESFRTWIENLRPGDGVVMELSGARPREAVLGLHPVSKLTALLREQDFDDARLAVLKPASARRKFRAAEIVRICGTFDFDQGKVEAIRACLPGLVDPENAFQIIGALEFQPAKADVSRLLEKLPPPQR
jgi:hypothetical protein